MIQTVDFFPPIVDDPYTFGQIAAANAISDIYAMGGVPKLAMNLICFPSCRAATARSSKQVPSSAAATPLKTPSLSMACASPVMSIPRIFWLTRLPRKAMFWS